LEQQNYVSNQTYSLNLSLGKITLAGGCHKFVMTQVYALR